MPRLPTLAFLVLALAAPLAARPAQADTSQESVAEIDGSSIRIYTYHPGNCAEPAFLFVFHGNGRGAKSYANSAREIADRACLLVVAPLFDEDRFSSADYHRGGIADDGRVKPRSDWTTGMVDDLIRWAEAHEGRKGQDIYLFGHSAGGQFLSRVAAYDLPDEVDRVVIANPSTYVLPTEDEAAPYGFAGFPSGSASDMMRDYLAAPITIFLGEDDVTSKDLTRGVQPDRQGRNRLDRGQRTYDMAKAVAERNGWPFNWRIVKADGIGHSGRGMLQSNDLVDALR